MSSKSHKLKKNKLNYKKLRVTIMKISSLTLLPILIGLAIATPLSANDFNKAFGRECNSNNHIGIKFHLSLGGNASNEPNLEINFGYNFKDANGRQTFVPLSGFNSSSGFNILGINKYSAAEGGDNKALIYTIGGIAVLGGGFFLLNEVAQAVEGGR